MSNNHEQQKVCDCGEPIVLVDGLWRRVGREDKMPACRSTKNGMHRPRVCSNHAAPVDAENQSMTSAERREGDTAKITTCKHCDVYIGELPSGIWVHVGEYGIAGSRECLRTNEEAAPAQAVDARKTEEPKPDAAGEAKLGRECPEVGDVCHLKECARIKDCFAQHDYSAPHSRDQSDLRDACTCACVGGHEACRIACDVSCGCAMHDDEPEPNGILYDQFKWERKERLRAEKSLSDLREAHRKLEREYAALRNHFDNACLIAEHSHISARPLSATVQKLKDRAEAAEQSHRKLADLASLAQRMADALEYALPHAWNFKCNYIQSMRGSLGDREAEQDSYDTAARALAAWKAA